jgi:hypothetical protein
MCAKREKTPPRCLMNLSSIEARRIQKRSAASSSMRGL